LAFGQSGFVQGFRHDYLLESSQGFGRIWTAESKLIDFIQVHGRPGTEGITLPLRQVAMIHQYNSSLVGPEVRTKPYTGPAECAQISFDDFFFQVLGTLDYRTHFFIPF
jgi:hypothetical protein